MGARQHFCRQGAGHAGQPCGLQPCNFDALRIAPKPVRCSRRTAASAQGWRRVPVGKQPQRTRSCPSRTIAPAARRTRTRLARRSGPKSGPWRNAGAGTAWAQRQSAHAERGARAGWGEQRPQLAGGRCARELGPLRPCARGRSGGRGRGISG